MGSYEQVFPITSVNDLELTGNGTRIICNTTAQGSNSTQPYVFICDNCERIAAHGFRLRDDGADISGSVAPNIGAALFTIVNNSQTPGTTKRGFVFRDSYVEKADTFLAIGNSGSARTAGIVVDNCTAELCYYGINAKDNGDELLARNVRTVNCRRPYFVYGVSRHDVELSIFHSGSGYYGAESAILIKRYVHDTRNIRVRPSFFGDVLQYATACTLEHEPTTTNATAQNAATSSVTGGTGLSANTTYYYRVTAIVGGREYSPSNERSVTTGAGSTNSNVISWTAVNNATGYRIYRGTAADTEHVYYAVGAVTSYTDTGAAATSGVVPLPIIADVDVELHLDDTLANPNSMTPFRFRSYTSGGTLETTTTSNRWDRIRLSGSLGAFSSTSGAMVFGAKSTTEGRLVIDPTISLSPSLNQPHFPGFVLRLAHDREIRTLKGDLTTQVVTIPLAGLDGNSFTLSVRVYAHDNYSSLAAQNSVFREDTIIGYNASGGGVAIFTPTNVFTHSQGTASTISYTANGENIQVGFTSYSNANAFARVEVQYVSRGPFAT